MFELFFATSTLRAIFGPARTRVRAGKQPPEFREIFHAFAGQFQVQGRADGQEMPILVARERQLNELFNRCAGP